MKKLMIVAAVAAMVGGAYAEDYVYDFSASLTTTTGKEGKDVKTTHYVGVGKDDNGNWWYDDAKLFGTAYTEGKKRYKDFLVGGKVVIEKALKYGSKQYPWKINTSVVKTDEQKALLAIALGYMPYSPVAKDGKPRNVTGTTHYDNQQMYKGKLVWCETFSFKVTDPAECYRDTGKVTIKGYVLADKLCIDDNPATLIEQNGDAYDFNFKFVNFFGSQVYEKATKVEALFDITNDADDGIDDADGSNLYFVLAGQGKYDAKLLAIDKKNGLYIDGISSISGNIVGYLPAPTCEACCADAAKAIAFECDVDVPRDDLPTAAYGTWSMKFNKKLSFQ